MTEERIVRICAFNNDYFAHGEDVKLYLELKNINKLTIKIFEFCSENYYLKTQKPIDPSMNLDGLIATEEIFFEYDEPPIVKRIKEFNFPNIAKR
jgi:hypothetical protein